MTAEVAQKLLAIVAAVALGWLAGRKRWLVAAGEAGDPARMLGNAAFTIFVPALLFRTAARIDFALLPWRTLAAFFGPAVLTLLLVYASQRRRGGGAAPSVRAISSTFGNSVQIGIPMAAGLFGEAGLAIHVTIVSLHALVLLAVVTTLVELDLAREAGRASLAQTLAQTLRNTVVHPVVLPVLAGLLWHAAGAPLPAAVDGVLQLLASAVVPLCLVLIGLSLATYGAGPRRGGAAGVLAVKLLVLPALVLAVARWGFGLAGTPLAVVVMLAAVPVGSNALLFAQRYRTLEAETTGAIVLSTLAFGLTAPLWLAVLARL
jgi:malonate transporter and related proteins